jgi:thiol-disulfide isomerase/thioredoxin
MQKKLLILLLVLLISGLYTGCTSGVLPGTDGPDSEPQPDLTPTTTKRVVMFELFEGPTCSRCRAIHPDIIRLRQEYGFDELVILEEYGVDFDPYTGWAVTDVLNRFMEYRKYSNDSSGLPDAYFNGLSQTVHHSDGEGYDNYKTAIEKELAKPAKVAINATYSVSAQKVTINGDITNISSDTLNNLVIEAMVYEDSVYSGFFGQNVDHVVRDIITYQESGEIINVFTPEDSYEFSLTSQYLGKVHDMNNIHVVVYVQAPNSSTKEILQAFYVE